MWRVCCMNLLSPPCLVRMPRRKGQNAQNGAAVAAVAGSGLHNAKGGDCTDAVVALAVSLTVRNLVARCPGTGRARRAAAAGAVKRAVALVRACVRG